MSWACAQGTATPEIFWIRSRRRRPKERRCPELAQRDVRANSEPRLGESLAGGKGLDAARRGDDTFTRSTESLQHGNEVGPILRDGNAIPFFRRAVEIDPKFAMALCAVGALYSAIGESVLSAESATKAWQLRDRVSDREKFFIDFIYDRQVTGNLEKAYQTLELWVQTYPRRGEHAIPWVCWEAFTTQGTGRFERRLKHARRNRGGSDSCHRRMAILRRPIFSRTASPKRRARFSAPPSASWKCLTLLVVRYNIAVLKGDQDADGPGSGSGQGQSQAGTLGGPRGGSRSGPFRPLRGRAACHRAAPWIWPCKRRITEPAASYRALTSRVGSPLRECAEGKKNAMAALELSKGRDVEYAAGFALALPGDFPDRGARRRFGKALPGRYFCEIHLRAGSSRVSRTGSGADPRKRGIARDRRSAMSWRSNGLTFIALSWRFALGLCARRGFHGGWHGIAKRRPSFRRFSIIGACAGRSYRRPGALATRRVFALSGDKAKAKAAYEDLPRTLERRRPRYPDPEKRKAEYAKAVDRAVTFGFRFLMLLVECRG